MLDNWLPLGNDAILRVAFNEESRCYIRLGQGLYEKCSSMLGILQRIPTADANPSKPCFLVVLRVTVYHHIQFGNGENAI